VADDDVRLDTQWEARKMMTGAVLIVMVVMMVLMCGGMAVGAGVAWSRRRRQRDR
jgi:hypothetical protein